MHAILGQGKWGKGREEPDDKGGTLRHGETGKKSEGTRRTLIGKGKRRPSSLFLADHQNETEPGERSGELEAAELRMDKRPKKNHGHPLSSPPAPRTQNKTTPGASFA